MDTALSLGKRYCKVKKKKTRKCFNNIKSNNNNENIIGFKTNVKNKQVRKHLKPMENITKNRLLLKHGLFAKGARSDTITRLGLSEEFKARSNENINKIIDLANQEVTKNNGQGVDKPQVLNGSELQCISIEPKPSSPFMQLDSDKGHCITTSVSHISPLRFLDRENSENIHRHISISSSSSDCCLVPTESSPAIIHLTDAYNDFTLMASQALGKYAPSTNNLQKNIKNSLQNVFLRHNNCPKMPEENNPVPVSIFSKTSSFRETLKTVTENSVILNPIQFLKNATRDTLDETNYKRKVSVQHHSSTHNEEGPIPRLSFLGSPGDILHSLVTFGDTPEPSYLPRRLNINK